MKTEAPIQFFSIVLNDMPFIRQHIKVFRALQLNCNWHIVEQVADLIRDMAWSVAAGGHISNRWNRDTLSIDDTTEYLDGLQDNRCYRVSIYREEEVWNDTIKTTRAPLASSCKNVLSGKLMQMRYKRVSK